MRFFFFFSIALQEGTWKIGRDISSVSAHTISHLILIGSLESDRRKGTLMQPRKRGLMMMWLEREEQGGEQVKFVLRSPECEGLSSMRG